MGKLGHLIKGQTSCLLAAVLLAGLATTSAQAAGPVIDGDLLVGDVSTYTVKKHESLFDVARHFDMGIIELEAANPGVSPWKPTPGTVVTVTTKHVIPSITHDGIVINLAASRLFYFKGPNEVMSFPVASGKEGWETPVAATKIVEKRLHPTWTIPENIRAEDPTLPESIPPGPNNPLGNYALALGLSGIMIHGTTSPASIGRHASHGCIRMYPEDIEALFNSVKKGTPVLITKTPYVLGWQDNKLYLQVTPKVHAVAKKKKKNADVAEAPKKIPSDPVLHQAIERQAATGIGTMVDWDAVADAISKSDGIPAVIGSRRESAAFVGPLTPVVASAAPAPVTPAVAPAVTMVPASTAPVKAEPEQRASLTVINDSVQMR